MARDSADTNVVIGDAIANAGVVMPDGPMDADTSGDDRRRPLTGVRPS
jgi:hypothetical protein